MSAKWRTARNAIAATLAVFAVLTATGWFGVRAIANLRDVQPDDTGEFIAFFPADVLICAVLFGGMMVIHWLAAAIGGRDNIRSRPADWLLGIAWLLILTVYVQAFFGLHPSWLAFVCAPVGPYGHDEGPQPCSRANGIWNVIIIFGPPLLLALSALTRIVTSRVDPVYD
jgi:hypothetical protein